MIQDALRGQPCDRIFHLRGIIYLIYKNLACIKKSIGPWRRLLFKKSMIINGESIMRLILIIAVLTLLFLPVLAVEPINLSGALGEIWLKIPENIEQDLWTWGGQPNYYYTGPNESYYYTVWSPYHATYPYYAGGHGIYVSSDFYTPYFNSYPHYMSLPPTSFYIYPMPK